MRDTTARRHVARQTGRAAGVAGRRAVYRGSRRVIRLRETGSGGGYKRQQSAPARVLRSGNRQRATCDGSVAAGVAARAEEREASRSEERRVGKEGRSRWSPYH